MASFLLESGRIQRGYKALFTAALSCQLKFPTFQQGMDTELTAASAERKGVEITTHNVREEVNL